MNDRTILLVDDEPHITHLLGLKLEQAGAAVLTADDGEQGYQLACEHKPDLVISDFQMPVLSGYEMSVKLAANPQTAAIPVLMLTARGHKLSEQELAQTNIGHLMAKPFGMRELIAQAQKLLGKSSSNQDKEQAA